MPETSSAASWISSRASSTALISPRRRLAAVLAACSSVAREARSSTGRPRTGHGGAAAAETGVLASRCCAGVIDAGIGRRSLTEPKRAGGGRLRDALDDFRRRRRGPPVRPRARRRVRQRSAHRQHVVHAALRQPARSAAPPVPRSAPFEARRLGDARCTAGTRSGEPPLPARRARRVVRQFGDYSRRRHRRARSVRSRAA